MSKPDAKLVARIFHKNINDTSVKHYVSPLTISQINIAMARQFADVFKSADPSFNRESFLKDCGVTND